ncbi:hypothetical protein SLUN_27465 [Streptomyces lunaelactis]|uniref:Uncharacterized protein n=1 Tax=Streptomyces lunaelactis TaxID=1535768 RepID=A0A2R4T8C6_9ACTN|nr:hypothetical protein SLUN_27465 [Streptomyces lunaelactis]
MVIVMLRRSAAQRADGGWCALSPGDGATGVVPLDEAARRFAYEPLFVSVITAVAMSSTFADRH